MVNYLGRQSELDLELSLPQWQHFLYTHAQRGIEALIKLSSENRKNLELDISGDNLNRMISDFTTPYKNGQTFNKDISYYSMIHDRLNSYVHGLDNIFSINLSKPENETQLLMKAASFKLLETHDLLECYYESSRRWQAAEPVFNKLMDKMWK